MSEEFKHTCQWCGGHIAYDSQYAGQTIQCPHCTKTITLGEAALVVQPNTASASYIHTTQAKPATKGILSARNIAVSASILLVVTAIGLGLHIAANKSAERKRGTDAQAAQTKAEAARVQAEADKAKAEAERAAAEARIAKLKAEEEERTKAAAKAAAEAEAATVAAAAKLKAEQDARSEEERKARAKKNPSIWALWEEQDHEAIQTLLTRPNDAVLKHKGSSLTVKYDDMPEWLRSAAQLRYKEEGEAKGFVRELDGKTYDLRTAPGGWVSLPTAEVIQIIEDGYLMVDVRSLYDEYAQTKVFKLKHNGLARILNKGDRIQLTAMSAGIYTYETKRGEISTVPVYDPGLPIGPLREKVVTMGGKPVKSGEKRVASSDEPVGNGSGFFISDDGLFVSNAHVVEDSIKIEVRTAAGKKQASVLRIDKDKDLALLRVSVVKGSVQALSISTNKLTLGAQVFTVGYPLVELQGSRPKFTDGKISSLAGIRDDPDQFQISVPVQPGNSGGPLADANGDIVGVVVARLSDLKVMAVAGSVPQNVNYAVKGATLIQFLKENKSLAPKVTIGNSAPRTQEEAIQAVEKASGLVLVY